MEIEIKGWDKLVAKLGPQLLARPVREFMDRSSITIENQAKVNSPIDTGRLRTSLTHEVDSAQVPSWAKIGSKVHYAPYMEYGTGLLSDGPGAHGRHWPPGEALHHWAFRHGIKGGGFALAAMIGKRGGLTPRRYLRNAFDSSKTAIEREARRLMERICEEWAQ